MFIYEECGNLKVFFDGGELTRNISKKRRQTLYKPTDVYSVTNAISESILSCIIL